MTENRYPFHYLDTEPLRLDSRAVYQGRHAPARAVALPLPLHRRLVLRVQGWLTRLGLVSV